MQGSADHKIAYSAGCAPAVTSVGVTNWSGYQLVFGDFNGDGKTDILTVSGTTNGGLYLSTGTDLTTSQYTVPTGWASYQVIAGDFNGDGKSDVALIYQGTGSGTSYIYLSTGSGFSQAASFTTSASTAIAADWDSDGATDLYLQGAGIYYTTSYVPELITTITTGLGATTTISYDRLNKNGSFYTKDTDATYPVKDIDGPLYAVKQVVTSNGVGGSYTLNYSYVGAEMHQQGRGFLGFRQRKVSDPQTNIVTTTSYDQEFPYIGLVDEETRVHSSVTLSDVVNSYCDGTTGCAGTTSTGVYFPYLTQSVVTAHDLDSTSLPTITTAYGDMSSTGYDTTYGCVLKVTVTTAGSDTATKVTTNTYATANTTNWIICQLTSASTVASFTGASDLTRSSSFSYDSNGLLTDENIEPSDGGALKQTTHYTYDGFGDRLTVGLGGNSITTRTTTMTYETTRARFATQIANPLSQSEIWGYDERFGLPTSQTGPNGIVTHWTYDGLGRKTNETRFYGLTDTNFTDVAYQYCSGTNGGSQTCPSGATFVVTATPTRGSTQNGPQSKTYYDALSRVVAEEVQGFYTQTYASCWIRTTTEYDSNGRISRVSRPYFTGSSSGCPADTVKWVTNTTIDDLGRATLVTNPNGGTVSTSYTGLTIAVTANVDGNSANNQTTTTVKNTLGLVKQVTDPNSKVTAHNYDAYGDLIKITDSLGTPNISRYSYDIRGRKLFACEPDKIAAVSTTCDSSTTASNKWSFTYDAFGELLSQVDAKGQTTTITYDALGRAVTRTESGLYSTWTYGTSSTNHDIGKLTQAQSCTDSTHCTGTDLKAQRVLTYDSYDRPSTVALTVSGTSQGTYTTTYDSDQHFATVTYPSSFEVQYSYTSLGSVYQLKEYSTTNPLWTADQRDALQHVTSEHSTNRANANVAIATTRTFDPNTGLPTELLAAGSSGSSGAFNWSTTVTPCTTNCWGSGNWTGGGVPFADFIYAYDYMGKMISRANAPASTTESFCYDKLNRLTDYAPASTCTGSGTVNVAYDEIGNLTKKSDVCTTSNCYAYPSSGGARPHAISSLTGTFNGASNPTFAYDNNGNMTSGAGRSVVYAAFNMSVEMTQGTSKLCWQYDADHQRVKMDEVSSCGGSPTSTTYYLNDSISGLMSEKVVSGSTTTYKDYLMAGGAMVGLRTKVGTGTPAIAYYALDHLGSIVVTTDEAGLLVCRIAYDPWGKSTASGSGCTAPTRGFTGEEAIKTGALVNLVNLNARVYDPVLGRFMAVDPILANPFSGQSLNQYSYVENSPLNAIDRTGMALCQAYYFGSNYQGSFCFPDTTPLAPPISCGSCGSYIDDMNSFTSTNYWLTSRMVDIIYSGLPISPGGANAGPGGTPSGGANHTVGQLQQPPAGSAASSQYLVAYEGDAKNTVAGQYAGDPNGAGTQVAANDTNGTAGFYNGLAGAIGTGATMVDAVDVGGAGLLSLTGSGKLTAGLITDLDSLLGKMGGVMIVSQQGFVALADINSGVPVGDAIAGATLHAGATIGGAQAGAAFGAFVGTPGGPLGQTLGAVVFGVAGAAGVEFTLPRNRDLGAAAAKAFSDPWMGGF
jgi:RHS repeat-associated protein